jgi:hypothetical protein
MGGLVTWANRCFRNPNTDRARFARDGCAVSSPMEEVGSWPVRAIGRSTTVISSLVCPNATWCRTRSSGGSATG